MILKDAELVLNSLQDLTVDIKHFPTRESYEFAKIRKTEAINIMIAKIKDIKYKIKKSELCSSFLDSLTICSICGEEALIVMKGIISNNNVNINFFIILHFLSNCI